MAPYATGADTDLREQVNPRLLVNKVGMSGARSGGGNGEGGVTSDGGSDPVPQQLVRGETTQTAEDHGDDEHAELLEQGPAQDWRNRWHGEHGGLL